MITTEEPTYHNRYLIFATSSDTKAWRLDLWNKPNGILVVQVNGVRQPKPSPEYQRLLAADNEMMLAFTAFMQKVDEKERM